MFSVTDDCSNKDIPTGMTTKAAREYYLEMARSGKAFKSKLGTPKFEIHMARRVLRCDQTLSFKALAVERYIASVKEDTLVYCAPRAGFAAIAIAKLAQLYGKKAVFFAPASAQASTHQLCVLALGAELRFVKIAAMPVLNSYAREWARKECALFLPFGLANLPQVTAGIVDLCDRLEKDHGAPSQVWCAVSTGVMARGLQIGWPRASVYGVAVARNMHPGEVGYANVTDAGVPFLQKAKIQPPFPTTAAYDAKAWGPCVELGRKGAAFINVGADQVIEDLAKQVDASKVHSQRAWGDFGDLS
jgi:hypothetical protein